MLRARCISAVARMAFPDVISGVYTPEELGGSVQVIDDQVVPAFSGSVPVLTQTDATYRRRARFVPRRGTASRQRAEQLARIEHMRRVRAVWYGEDETHPAPESREEADKAITLLQGILRLPVPGAETPVTSDQRALVVEALRDLEAMGGRPGAIPADLTPARLQYVQGSGPAACSAAGRTSLTVHLVWISHGDRSAGMLQ